MVAKNCWERNYIVKKSVYKKMSRLKDKCLTFTAEEFNCFEQTDRQTDRQERETDRQTDTRHWIIQLEIRIYLIKFSWSYIEPITRMGRFNKNTFLFQLRQTVFMTGFIRMMFQKWWHPNNKENVTVIQPWWLGGRASAS